VFRLVVFLFLALPVVQCQTGVSTHATDQTKPAGKDAQKAGNATSPGTAPTGSDTSKTDAAKATAVRLENARLDAIDSDYASMSLTDCVAGPDPQKIVCNGKAYQVKVNDQALRAKLKQYHVGDHVRVDINEADQKEELKDLLGASAAPKDGICVAYRLLVLIGCALVILGLAALATQGSPLKFIVGMDNRYSNSKFQIAVWFWIVLTTYLAVVVFRLWYAGWDFFGGVSIPQHLLELSGLSAITYGGAKAITTSKVNAAMAPKTGGPDGANPANPPATNQPNQNAGAQVAAAAAAPPNANPPNSNPAYPGGAGTPPAALNFAFSGSIAPPAMQFSGTGSFSAVQNPKNPLKPGEERFFRDLVQNDVGGFDFGDFQMVVVTLVAVGMYMMLIFHFLESIQFLKTASLPDVDTTILASFGLGQGAYLAKKAGGNVGTS
jgi:hypothetical protein